MLDLEWSKDDDTKTQCNRLNTSPLHRGNASNKNGPAQVKRQMQEVAQRVNNCEQQLDFFTTAIIGPSTRADHGHPRGN